MKYPIQNILTLSIAILFFYCSPNNKETITTDENGFVILTDDQVENIIKRSYQYVALYNVNNKFALKQGGWNTLQADTQLKDHTTREIARPNNDTFYTSALLDLRAEPIILEWPAFDSEYVSLMITSHDHYVDIPKSTRLDDFSEPEKMLLYSDRTKGYRGDEVLGVKTIYKTTGDFISALFRVMPHANEPERFKDIVEQIKSINMLTLSEYTGGKAKVAKEISFPAVGKTDLDVFENNLLEVMQFVFDHVTFEAADEMDQKVLEAYKPLGMGPGTKYNPEKVKIDGKRFRAAAEKIQQEYLSKLSDSKLVYTMAPKMFKVKGGTDLETILTVSIIGPIGMPMEEAMYPNVITVSGDPMNALNDYVIKMTKDELPPAQAFWSLTLYDKANGFFIPNDRKKYSVGLNAGYKLNEDGGIEVYVAAEKPQGVPEENWLPINRKDEEIDIILRIYVPDLEKMQTWRAPKAKKL